MENGEQGLEHTEGNLADLVGRLDEAGVRVGLRVRRDAQNPLSHAWRVATGRNVSLNVLEHAES